MQPFWEETYKIKYFNTLGTPSQELIDLIPNLPQGGSVLDVGCGDGRNCVFMAEQGFNVDAFDISKNAISKIEGLCNELH
jgi:tellurite methyltransferase